MIISQNRLLIDGHILFVAGLRENILIRLDRLLVNGYLLLIGGLSFYLVVS